MATIKICDRCGGPINPRHGGTTLRFSDICLCPRDLCVSCTHQLRKWLRNKPIEEVKKNADE